MNIRSRARAGLACASAFSVLGVVAGAAEPEERVSELLSRGQDATAAVRVSDEIWLSPGNSNVYLVRTPKGDVLIDSGLSIQGEKQRRMLLEAIPDLSLQAIILTHSHADHIGGVRFWKQPDVPIIAHRLLEQRNQDHVRLAEFRDRRARVLWGAVMPEGGPAYAEITPDVLVDDLHSFQLGGVRFDVIATPGGEGPDAVSVWIPAYGALFPGDALGPTLASFPNLFTLRGENLREAWPMLETLDALRALEAEILLPGHFEPVQGKQEIRSLLTRTAEGIRYVHDATVAGMNEGKNLWTLMQEVELPPHLELNQQYGRVDWGVRAIYESYTGWFRYESTTELYATPPNAVYAELGQLIGADALAERAYARVKAGELMQALHLCDVALAAKPGYPPALRARLAALSALAAQEGRSNFQVAGWLRHRIRETQAELDANAK